MLRDTLGLTGTKYGCGIAQCGACTVHIDGVATRSCSGAGERRRRQEDHHDRGPVAANGKLHPVQQAWLEHDVPQCGYCQSGMIMAVAALLKEKPKPTDADIDAAITNICRCGTYQQVRAAIHAAAPRREGGRTMTIDLDAQSPSLFLVSGAAVGGGFSLGFHVPFGAARRSAADGRRRSTPGW